MVSVEERKRKREMRETGVSRVSICFPFHALFIFPQLSTQPSIPPSEGDREVWLNWERDREERGERLERERERIEKRE